MAAQLDLALNNLEAVLVAGDMTLANIVRQAYTTDVDELFKRWQIRRTASGTPMLALRPRFSA